ncbi:MAG: site-specific integrase, partial [Nitrososphaeraceae archaeon]
MQIVDSGKATFLNSIERGSHNTKRLYSTSLNHFAQFLKERNLTPDTIIAPLQTGQINAYELLNQFVNYLLDQKVNLLSLKVYVSVIRSFLEYS